MFLISNLNVGGTEKALINMLEIMDKDLYEVDVWVLQKKGGFLNELPEWVNLKVVDGYEEIEEWIMGIPLQIVKKLAYKGEIITAIKLGVTHLILKATRDRTQYYNVVLNTMSDIKEVYDTAIAYAGPADFLTMYILNKVKADEKIQWIHFDISKFGLNTKLVARNYPLFDRIVVVSKVAAEKLIQKVPSIKEKVEVIPNFLPEKLCLKKSLEYNPYGNETRKRLLTVGRLTSEKGQIIIPEVVNLLIKRGIEDFVWYVVGDGNQRKVIDEKIKEYGLEEYIKMEGLTNNPYPHYKGTDLYVQTSLHEGYCITIAEALLFQKYVISTDVAGAYDQIKDKEIGVITKFDAECLADEIERYIKSEEKDGKI